MIYIYHAEGTDLYKVGYTSRKDADRRRKEWETGCPFPLELVGTTEGDRGDEARVHRRLKRAGKWMEEAAGQEWFRLSPEDIEQILGHRPTPVEDTLLDSAQELGEGYIKRKLNNISRRKGAQGLAGKALKWLWKKR